ncbi:MAG: hypothetical protein Q9157_001924 [Trypethelium eluteriae]
MTIMSLLTLLALTLGTTTARKCQNITVPIDISARVGIFNIQAPASDIDTTNFFLNDTQQGHNFTQEILEGTAVDQYDFSTVTWDRLGIGMSSHGDPVSAIQEPLEEAALHALTNMTRNGELPGIDCKFDKVVHVGHSFGSVISYSLTRDYPTASDGLILTGFSGNATFLAYFALGGNFVLANTIPHLSAYPAGYFAAGDASGVQTNFFAPGDFDPNILELGFQTQQPVTAGEILTIAASGVNHFAGPVIVITGERDVPFCGGDCLATGNPALPNIPDDVKPDFPNASVFKTFIVPASGHGLNLEYSHKTTYHVAQQFLNENGL